MILSVPAVSCLFFDLLIYATKKIAQGAGQFRQLDTKRGGGIQGISAASAARAETLSDALGTRLEDKQTGDFKNVL